MSLKIKKGNTWISEVPIYDNDVDKNLVQNLAAALDISFMIKRNQTDITALVHKTVGDGITVDDPKTGYVKLQLNPSDTSQIPDKYWMALEVFWDSNTNYEVFMKVDDKWDDQLEISQDTI